MDTIVAPLRDSVHNVSNVIKTVPDGLTDGFKQMSGGLQKMFKVSLNWDSFMCYKFSN